MNKSILMIFAVVLCAATAFAFPNIDIADEEVVGEVLAIEDITPEQRKCIETAVADAKKKDPAFGKWIDQVDQARQVLEGKAKKCHELGNILQQKRCLLKVKLQAKSEWVRLVKQLSPEQKLKLDALKGEVEKCLKH